MVHIVQLVSYSRPTYFCCQKVFELIFEVGCIINTKLVSCVDIIHHISLGFRRLSPKCTCPTNSFQCTSWENLMMCRGLYLNTQWFVDYIYVTCYIYIYTEREGGRQGERQTEDFLLLKILTYQTESLQSLC